MPTRGGSSCPGCHLRHRAKAGASAGTPVVSARPCPRGWGAARVGEAQPGSPLAAPGWFWQQDAAVCLAPLRFPRLPETWLQQRAGGGPRGLGTPLPCPPFRCTQLFHRAGGSGRASPERCWMLLVAAAVTHQPRGAVAGNHRHPRSGPPGTAPPAMGKLFPPLSRVSSAVRPWAGSRNRGQGPGTVGRVPEPWEGSRSRGSVREAWRAHPTGRVSRSGPCSPLTGCYRPPVWPPPGPSPAPYLRRAAGTLWG